MRKSYLIVALASSAAMVVASAAASTASGAGNNAGHAVHLKPAHVAVAHGVQPMAFKPIAQPTGKYLTKTCDIDLSGIADGTMLNTVSGCGTTVTLGGSQWEKVSVPNFWASWNCPPATESCTPNALWSAGQTQSTVDFGVSTRWGGMEIEPDAFQTDTIQVDFYKGANGTGKLRGSITLQPNGQSGALLFAAHSKRAFRSVVITDQSSDDFAIAQIRL